MEIPEDTEFEKYSAVARLSCMIDGKSDFILSSNLSHEFTDEITDALWHLMDVKNRINLKHTIITFDRFYNSIELMLTIMLLESFFIIMSKTSTFKKQQEIMNMTQYLR